MSEPFKMPPPVNVDAGLPLPSLTMRHVALEAVPAVSVKVKVSPALTLRLPPEELGALEMVVESEKLAQLLGTWACALKAKASAASGARRTQRENDDMNKSLALIG